MSIAVHLVDDLSDTVTTRPVGIGPTTTTRSHAWDDPGIDVVYRVFSQPEAPFYLALIPQYLHNVSTHDQVFAFQEQAGWVNGDLILAIAENTTHHQFEDTGGAGRRDYWVIQLGSSAFYQLSDRWSVNADLDYQFNPAENGNRIFQLHGQVNYDLIPDKLQASVEYEHDFFANTARNRDRSGNVVGVRLGFLFDLYDPHR